MVSQQLVQYIQEQLQRGFPASTIKAQLLKYGYQPADVNNAFQFLYGGHVKHTIHFSPTALIGISVVLVSVLVGVFVFLQFFSGASAPSELLDISLEPVSTRIAGGEQATIIAEIDNLGSSTRYDVTIKYEVINAITSKRLTFKEETRALETKSSKQVKIDIPADARAGEYLVRAIATYNGQRAVATIPLTIVEGTQELPQQPVPTPAPEPSTPEPSEPEEPAEEEQPTTGAGFTQPSGSSDAALNTFEVLQEVESKAPSDRAGAEALCQQLQLQTSRDLCYNKMSEVLQDRSYCTQIGDERTRDVCLSNVAKLLNRYEICEEISKDSRKDNCYMNFVLENKDYTICDRFVSQYMSQSCESLKQLAQLNITDVAFYEALVNQVSLELI